MHTVVEPYIEYMLRYIKLNAKELHINAKGIKKQYAISGIGFYRIFIKKYN